MENDSSSSIVSLVDLLEDQLNTLLVVISRPAVQRQIIAVLLVLVLTWLLLKSTRRWQKHRRKAIKTVPTEGITPKPYRWAGLNYLLHPVIALVCLYITIWLFSQRDYPKGLLEELTLLFWIWFIYRSLITLLFTQYRESARPYINWIVRPLFIFLLFLQIIGTLPGSVTFIDATINLGTLSVSLGNLLAALITLYIFFNTAWIIKQIMIRTLPNRLNAGPGVIDSVATLARYALLAFGIIVSLSMIGLDITSLAIIAGGLSVGVGIGLQDIVSNFISGLVLLFEQSLKPGDIVEISGRINQVEKISLRATTVRTRTNEELIIPNNNFTSQQVINLTKSDRLVQVVIPIGVSYKSDPESVSKLAIETSLKHHLVLAEPPPELLFRGYGESSLNFDLLVSVDQPEKTMRIRSDLYYMLWKVFAKHEIEIPFPQRDLNLGVGWEKFTSGFLPE